MKTSPMLPAVAVTAALVGMSVAGCHDNTKSSTATTSGSATSTSTPASSASTPAAQPTDYTRLLIRAEDINAPQAFTAGPPTLNPNGSQGVAATFRNGDGTHVIVDTIVILPDPAAAAAALDADKAAIPGAGNGNPRPIDVGTGGTTVSGNSSDESVGITVLRFTEGKAFVTLEFDGPAGMAAPPDFVGDVGRKQDSAIKNGLPS